MSIAVQKEKLQTQVTDPTSCILNKIFIIDFLTLNKKIDKIFKFLKFS